MPHIGELLGTVSTLARRGQVFTWAALQAAYPNNGAAFLALPLGYWFVVSDIALDPIIVTRGATRWRIPDATRVKFNAADVVINTASETIAIQWQSKAGLLGDRAILRFDMDASDSGTTTTYTGRIRVGTAGTTADTQVVSNTGWLASTARIAGVTQEIERRSATAVNQRGAVSTTLNTTYMEINGNNARTANTAVADMDSNAVYFSLTMQPNNTTDTLTINSGGVTILTCGT